MDWFKKLTGFKEGDYASTRAKLMVEHGVLTSRVNGRRYRTGHLEFAMLSRLRSAAKLRPAGAGRLRVTNAPDPLPLVSQAFCSALPVAYSEIGPVHWKRFARLVLEAAYEATIWAAVLNAARGRSNIALLTSLGGGAFGNPKS